MKSLTYSEDHFGRKRKVQEDSQYSKTINDATSPILSLLVVADGMGGHEAGEIASGFTRDILVNLFVKNNYLEFAKKFGIVNKSNLVEYFKEICNQTIYYIHNKLRQKAESKIMGSTCTFALVLKSDTQVRDVIIGHVGDSRAYIAKGPVLKQITEDDSIVWQSYRAGEISKEQMRNKKGSNVLTNALGGDRLDPPHIYHIKMDKNSTLLLCSDGLHGLISDKRINQTIQASKSLKEIAKKLIYYANAAGGKDNISIALYSEGIKAFPPPKRKKIKYILIPSVALTMIFAFLITYSIISNSNNKDDKKVEEASEENENNKLDKYFIETSIDGIWIKGKEGRVETKIKTLDSSVHNYSNLGIFYHISSPKGDSDQEHIKLSNKLNSDVKLDSLDETTIIVEKSFDFDFTGKYTIRITVYQTDESKKLKVETKEVTVRPYDQKDVVRLIIYPTELNLGKIYQFEKSEPKSIKITNQSSRATQVNIVQPINSDLIISQQKFRLKPNISKNIEVSYKPKYKGEKNLGFNIEYENSRKRKVIKIFAEVIEARVTGHVRTHVDSSITYVIFNVKNDDLKIESCAVGKDIIPIETDDNINWTVKLNKPFDLPSKMVLKLNNGQSIESYSEDWTTNKINKIITE